MFYRSSEVVKPKIIETRLRLIDFDSTKHRNVFIKISGEMYKIICVSKQTDRSVKTNVYTLVKNDVIYMMHISNGVVYLYNTHTNAVIGVSVSFTNMTKHNGFYHVKFESETERGSIRGRALAVGDKVDNRFVVKAISDNYILLESKTGNPKVINKDSTTGECIYVGRESLHNYVVSRFI